MMIKIVNHTYILTVAVLLISLCFSSCTAVQPYQRAFLNDSNMEPGSLNSEGFEETVFNYREGAIISGTKKGKGGCGCN